MAKENKNTSVGLDENIAALLAYLFGWISGLIFLLVEKKSDFVRFSGAQSLVFSVITIVVGWIIAVITFVIPKFGWIILAAYYLAILGIWIVLIVKAYQHEEFRLPVIADLADKLLGAISKK